MTTETLSLEKRIKALRLPKGANAQTRALFSNLKRHGPRLPAKQAERMIELIEHAADVYRLPEPPTTTT